MLALSFLFIVSASLPFAIYFLGNVALTYCAGRLISSGGVRKRRIFSFTLAWLIGNLCFFKYFNTISAGLSTIGAKLSLFPQFHPPVIFLPLGMSYLVFRLSHYLFELYRGNIPKSNFVDFALYALFFPTFLAGPVERFQRFYPQSRQAGIFSLSECNYGLFRIALGIIKKFIIADNLANLIMPVFQSPDGYSRAAVILAVYGLALRIYLDFSGYTDMAIGVSRLFGYRIMENFNKPFLQKNIALFWRHWHISVYSWIRDYFFFPLFGFKASILKLYLGIFLTMVVFHLWHAASIGFLVMGIYHGTGLILWQLFRESKKKLPVFAKLMSYKILDPVSVFLTFSFVSFGFIFFEFKFYQSLSIIKRLLINA
ncbi:MAG: MBOAT family O-acyltransferase [Candidatus Omnitrophota bacterium]